MQETPPTPAKPRFRLPNLGSETWLILLVIILGFGGYCTAKVKDLIATRRQKELLTEFVQTTDMFTRPIIYSHKRFAAAKTKQFPQDWLYRITVNSEGLIYIPTPGPEAFSIKIAYEDEVISFNSDFAGSYFAEHNKKEEERLSRLAGTLGNLDELRIPIRKQATKNIDSTLEGDDLKALVETMELARLIRRNNNR
jgi:hypothetical protein